MRESHDRYTVPTKKDGVIAEVIANHWPLTSKDLTIVLVVFEEGEKYCVSIVTP